MHGPHKFAHAHPSGQLQPEGWPGDMKHVIIQLSPHGNWMDVHLHSPLQLWAGNTTAECLPPVPSLDKMTIEFKI